jgi:hypothetical protein
MKKTKKMWLLPLGAFVIAIASAFASNAVSSETIAPMGYIDAPSPCHISVPCSTTWGKVCRSESQQQAFGLNAQGTACNVELYKL